MSGPPMGANLFPNANEAPNPHFSIRSDALAWPPSGLKVCTRDERAIAPEMRPCSAANLRRVL